MPNYFGLIVEFEHEETTFWIYQTILECLVHEVPYSHHSNLVHPRITEVSYLRSHLRAIHPA